MPRFVLFDLDGTLSDSATGILASLRHAFAVHGIPPLPPATERALLGPPFYDSLPGIVGEDRLWDVIDSYRAFYRAGAMYETSVFDGITDVLAAARRAGLRMAVATSKPEAQAVPIVDRLGLADYFETVGGDLLDGSRGTKALVVGEVLERLGNPAPHEVVMVGDRAHDVIGARAHGVRCIGVRWGYAPPGELEAEGADPICATPHELRAALGLADGDAGAAAS